MAKNINNPKNNEERIQSKKDSILKEKSKISMFHIITIALIIAAGAAFIISNIDKGKSSFQADDRSSRQNVPVQMTNLTDSGSKDVVYDLSSFDDEKAKFFQYQYQNGNINIKYFIMKSADGKIRAAFDACDVCWREGKGYTQKGDNMICINCGNRFPSNKINVITGGCNPGTLVVSVQNGKIAVKQDEVLKGAKYFNFARRG